MSFNTVEFDDKLQLIISILIANSDYINVNVSPSANVFGVIVMSENSISL